MSYTYTTLKQAIKDYTENDETTFVSNLPVFIRNTEERILKNVQLSLFQRNASGVMSASNKFLTCPSDFLAPFSLSFTNAQGFQGFLDFKSQYQYGYWFSWRDKWGSGLVKLKEYTDGSLRGSIYMNDATYPGKLMGDFVGYK